MRLRARLGGVAAAFSDARDSGRSGLLASGIRAIDTCLDGGLAINAVHEIRCELARDAGSFVPVKLLSLGLAIAAMLAAFGTNNPQLRIPEKGEDL